MTTKHTPATPLPWKGPSSVKSSMFPPFLIRGEIPTADAAYIAHACNSYPKLVEALRDCAEWLCEAHQGSDQWERGHAARALLSELGESK